MRLKIVIATLCLVLIAPAWAQAEDKVMLRLFADRGAAVPGQTLHLAVEQTIVPGWHTYWINPGDSGEPMKINWTLPEGYEVSPLLWPAPERVPYGPLMNFGYSERAVMLADLAVPSDAKIGGTLDVTGDASVLVCDEICIPENHAIKLSLPIAAMAGIANADLFADAGARIAQPVDWPTVTEVDANEVRVRVMLPSADNIFVQDADNTVWFPREWGYIENASDQSATFEPTTLTLTLRQSRVHDRNVAEIKDASYLVRNGDSAVIVSGSIAETAPPTMGEKIADEVVLSSNASYPFVILCAFLGGLILNLMPCVFPVLSIKALHLVSLPKSERMHAQASGVLYALGVITMFLVLAGVLFALRAGGEQLGWGFQLQNPAVVAGLSWLLFVTGLNLAGVFDLRIAFGGEVLLAEKHHPLVTAFLTGVLATLVATPCTAPFMATAIGAALSQSVPVALAIFAAVGLGLAFPYLLLCFVPALQKILPKPGAWMETFRQVLAFPMFASAVWLVWVISQQGGAQAVAWTLGGMVALAFAIWLVDRHPVTKTARQVVTFAGLIVIVATFASLTWIVPLPRETDENATEHVRIENYDYETFRQVLDDEDAPVFVNMTASWCITCLVNEKVTLNTNEVRDLFAGKGVRYFKGDWTNKDQMITGFLRQYGRSGVPLYVYFGPRDIQTGIRPVPVVLPQILSVDTMIETIQ